LANPLVPLLEIQETFSKLQARIPKILVEVLSKMLTEWKLAIENNKDSQSFAARVKAEILKYYDSIPSNQPQQQKDFMNLMQPVLELATKFEQGMAKYAEGLYISLLKEYLAVEGNYQIPRENLIASLRQVHKDEPKRIWDIEISHHSLTEKNKLVLQLLEEIEKIGLGPYGSILHELSDLQGLGHREVAFKARRMLVMYRLPSFASRMASLEKELSSRERIIQLISQPSSIFDVIVACLFHTTGQIRSAAFEIYLGRTYQAYLVKDLEINGTRAEWYYAAPTKKSDRLAMQRVNTDDNLVKMESDQNAEFTEGREHL
jgi:acetyl-CoA carboxylase/biotin carboxylase 1